MLVDVGTNTEVVLAGNGRILVASCPAGPAFEGGSVTYGMQAAEGAIESVELDAGGAFTSAHDRRCARARALRLRADRPARSAADRTGRMTPKGVFADRARDSSTSTPGRASRSRAPTARRSHRPRPRTRSASGSCCVSSASTRATSIACTSPAASRPTSMSRNAIEIGFLAPVPIDRIEKVGNASLRGARLLLLSRRRAAAPGRADPADRARRARDDARLLRAVRRRVPVQAAPRSARRLRTPAPELRRGGGRRFEGGTDDAREIRRERRGIAAVRRDRREHPHDARHAPSGAARRSPTRTAVSRSCSSTRRGETHLLPIPPEELRTQDYQEGRVKHVRSAVRVALSGGADAPTRPRLPARRRTPAGRARARSYLDVNVDEYSHRLHEQIEAMTWLVGDARADRRRAALDRLLEPRDHRARAWRRAEATREPPMLNSASLERARGARPRRRDRWCRDRHRGRRARACRRTPSERVANAQPR